MIVVATELEVRNLWRFIPFVRHSIRCNKQAQDSPGCLKVMVGNKGWRTGYTLTAWKDMGSMQQFRNSGAHKTAMQQVSKLSRRYKTGIWETDTLPSWKEAKEKLQEIPFKELQ